MYMSTPVFPEVDLLSYGSPSKRFWCRRGGFHFHWFRAFASTCFLAELWFLLSILRKACFDFRFANWPHLRKTLLEIVTFPESCNNSKQKKGSLRFLRIWEASSRKFHIRTSTPDYLILYTPVFWAGKRPWSGIACKWSSVLCSFLGISSMPFVSNS